MSPKRKLFLLGWALIFASFLGFELWAAFDGSDNTVPLTVALWTYVNPNILFLGLGGLFLWFTYHMIKTYEKPKPARDGKPLIKKGTDTHGTGKGRPLPPK